MAFLQGDQFELQQISMFAYIYICLYICVYECYISGSLLHGGYRIVLILPFLAEQ